MDIMRNAFRSAHADCETRIQFLRGIMEFAFHCTYRILLCQDGSGLRLYFLDSTWVAIGVTVICYVTMFQEIQRSRTWGNMPKASDAVIAKRFFWIIAAGIMCSTPIIICKFLAYGGVILPGKYNWTKAIYKILIKDFSLKLVDIFKKIIMSQCHRIILSCCQTMYFCTG